MDFESYYNLAEDYYVHNDYNKAIDFFNKCITLSNSDDYWIFHSKNYIGVCCMEMGDYSTASSIFLELIDLYPFHERPVMSLGRVYLKQNKFQDAFECFEKAISLNPGNEETYYYMGVYYDKIQDTKQAIKYYEKAISIDYEHAETHLNLGVCYGNMKLYEKAMDEFDISYSQNTADNMPLHNKALVLYNIGNYTKAIEILLYLNDIDKDNIKYMIDIADAYLSINDLENSTKWTDIILQVSSDDLKAKKAYVIKAHCLERRGKYDAALEAYDKAISLDKKYKHAYNQKGQLFCYLKRYEEACTCYEKALLIDPNYVDAYYNKAIIYDLTGDVDAAINYLNKAFQIDDKFIEYAKDEKVFTERIYNQLNF